MAKVKSILALATALTLAGTAAAQAGTVTLTEQEPGNVFGTPNWSETMTITVGTDTSNTQAGAFRLNDGIQDLLAFCIDPETFLDLNQPFDTMVQALTPTIFTQVDKLFTSSYAQVVDATTAAGFQIALWEIIEDTANGYDLTSGVFSAAGNAAVLAQADLFLGALAMAGTGGYIYTTYVNAGQDLISAAPVPVPAAALLFAPALAGMAMRKKRKA